MNELRELIIGFYTDKMEREHSPSDRLKYLTNLKAELTALEEAIAVTTLPQITTG